jgi:hypothetical protein
MKKYLLNYLFLIFVLQLPLLFLLILGGEYFKGGPLWLVFIYLYAIPGAYMVDLLGALGFQDQDIASLIATVFMMLAYSLLFGGIATVVRHRVTNLMQN